jgi:hypothetical protein
VWLTATAQRAGHTAPVIIATREDIAEQLWLRDEQDLAVAMLDVDAATHRRVMERAARPTTALFHSEVDQLLVAAAVRILGGRRRPASWDPRPENDLADFWQLVGAERDRRNHDDPGADVLDLLGD